MISCELPFFIYYYFSPMSSRLSCADVKSLSAERNLEMKSRAGTSASSAFYDENR